jgi:hypothetical protein
MMNLEREKRVTFNSVAWILSLITICQLNPLMGLGFMLSFWIILW